MHHRRHISRYTETNPEYECHHASKSEGLKSFHNRRTNSCVIPQRIVPRPLIKQLRNSKKSNKSINNIESSSKQASRKHLKIRSSLLMTKSKPKQIKQRQNDHRRLSNSLKISDKIITMNSFFQQENSALETDGNSMLRNPSENSLAKTTNCPESQMTKQQSNLIQHSHQNSCQSKLTIKGIVLQTDSLSHSKHTLCSFYKRTKTQLLSPSGIQNCKSKILQSQTIRSHKKLRPNPKQWHFHDCLNLQNIPLYRNNLRLSCQGWVILDQLQVKYLRGWNPKEIDDFSPLLRLFVFKAYCDLHHSGAIEIDEVTVRVNNQRLPDKIKEETGKDRKEAEGINPHSILSIRKLITAMLITKFQDILFYACDALGYILMSINKEQHKSAIQSSKHLATKPILKFQRNHIYLKENSGYYLSFVESQCNRICSRLSLQQTTVILTQCKYSVKSTTLDLSVLMMKCLGDEIFLDSLQQKIYQPEIRYQIGWHFWETRVQKWVNSEMTQTGITALGGTNQRNNQCYAIWDKRRGLICVMADCKVNMHFRDADRIFGWAEKHIPRFSKKYELIMSFYPTDTQKLFRIQ